MKRILFLTLIAGVGLANPSNDVRFARYNVKSDLVPVNHFETFLVIRKDIANQILSEPMIAAAKQRAPNWNPPTEGITVRQFSLYALDLNDTNTLIQVAINYAGNYGRISYDIVDSDDVALFMLFANMFGYNDSHLLDVKEKNALVKEVRGW
jgi:hypothetical protein